MKMATSLKKLIMVSALLLFFLLSDFETSAASFANDGQEKGWLNKRLETRERKFVGGSGLVGENSNLFGGKPTSFVRRAQLFGVQQWPPSPVRGPADHVGGS